MNKSFIYSISLLLILLCYSCDSIVPLLSPEEQQLANRAQLVITMDEANSETTISVKQFANVSFIQFSVIYNYNKLSVNGYSKPHSSLMWSNLDDPNLDHEKLEFIFNGTIKNELDLVTIKFGLPSMYEGTRIIFDDILIKDSGGESIYFLCSNSIYNDPLVCSVSGGSWYYDGDEFVPLGTCYISQHPTSDNDEDGELDYLFENNEYKWTDNYCSPSQDGGP